LTQWTYEQIRAWHYWGDLAMVERVAPRPGAGPDGEIETVDSLLLAQRRALREPWRPSLRARNPRPPDPAANFPPVVGSEEAFERIFRQAINDGRLTETKFHMFDAAEAMRVLRVPAPVHPPTVVPERGPSNPSTASADKPKRKRGPEKGSSRYGTADRELYPELEKLMRADGLSPNAAATKLAEANLVKGAGTPASRGKRLAARYISDKKNSLKLTETFAN
jgi:hypothetical protein